MLKCILSCYIKTYLCDFICWWSLWCLFFSSLSWVKFSLKTLVYNGLSSGILPSYVLMLTPSSSPSSFSFRYLILLSPVRQQQQLTSSSHRHSELSQWAERRGPCVQAEKGWVSRILNASLLPQARPSCCPLQMWVFTISWRWAAAHFCSPIITAILDIILHIRATEEKARWQGQHELNKVNIWHLLGRKSSLRPPRSFREHTLASVHGCVQIPIMFVRFLFTLEKHI